MQRELAEQLVGVLADAGTDMLFGMPGGGVNLEIVGAAMDAGMGFVLTHGETSSCIMAGTYGALRSQPGLATMTRGPGAASAVNGAAQATLDRSPLVIVSDTVGADEIGWMPHQRIDQQAMFSPVTKFSGTIGHGDAGALSRAVVALALRQPAGAVHLDFDPSAPSDPPPDVPEEPDDPDPETLEKAFSLAGGARRPVVLAGTEAWPWVEEVRAFVAETGCPVLTTYQARGIVPDTSPHVAGVFTNGAIERPLIDSADLVLAVGLDPVELIPREWTFEAPVLSLLPWRLTDHYFKPAVEIVSPVGAALTELRRAVDASGWDDDEAAEFRRKSLQSLVGAARQTDRLDPVDVVEVLDEATPDGTTLTVDAGAHMLVAVPMLTVTQPRGMLISNGIATMGYAVPAAIAAALARPEQTIVALTGDGGLGMVLAELETIARLGLNITVVVFNDAALSLIEIKQGDRHGGPQAVRYGDTDFSAVARGMGIPATRIATRSEIESVLAEPWEGPRLIDVRVDPAMYRHVIGVTRG